MVPQYFIKLEKFPYTPNGKIDRKSLPEPIVETRCKNIISPRNNTDKILVKILESLLTIKNIRISDSFF